MKIPLIGGPRDGQLVEVDVYNEGLPSQWIPDDFEMYFPHDEKTIEPIATYRWLFGYADHLDFAGWQK